MERLEIIAKMKVLYIMTFSSISFAHQIANVNETSHIKFVASRMSE